MDIREVNEDHHRYEEIENLFAFRVLMPFHEGDNGWAFKGDYLGIPTFTNNIELKLEEITIS